MYKSDKVAERIKQLAKVRKIQLKDMLLELDLNKNTMSNMYKGSMIKADSLAKIADYLDCSVDFLLGRSDSKTRQTFSVISVTAEEKANAKLKKWVTGFEELNDEAQNAVLDYLNFTCTQPKNLKNIDNSDQMNA